MHCPYCRHNDTRVVDSRERARELIASAEADARALDLAGLVAEAERERATLH